MAIHGGLDLRRPHLEATDIDHALQPIHREEVTVAVAIAEIAGAQEALAIDFDESGRIGLGPVPVALQHLRAMHHNLAGLVMTEFGESFRIDHPRIGFMHRDTKALALWRIKRIDVGR